MKSMKLLIERLLGNTKRRRQRKFQAIEVELKNLRRLKTEMDGLRVAGKIESYKAIREILFEGEGVKMSLIKTQVLKKRQ